MARYNAVNAIAETTAQTPFQPYSGEFVAGLSPTQQAGIQNTSQYSQSAQPYYNAATGLTLGGAQNVGPLTGQQIGYYMDPYVQSVAAPTMKALQLQQGQEQSKLAGQQAMTGAFGNDRAGLERANLSRQQELATAQTLAPLYSQAYQQGVQTATGQQGVVASDLARQMQAGQQLAGLGTGAQQAALQGAQAQIGAGTLQQQTQQAQDTAQYQQFLQERGYPFQVAQFLANIAMGTGALSGSTTTSTQPAPFFSDARLKDNIEPIGETYDGQPIYRYDMGDGRTQIGLMAQEVLARGKPGVGLDPSGYLTVDYRDATDDAAELASMGGAVDEPGGYKRGGYVGGGLVGADDIRAILASQAQSFGPFSQAGLYGGAGAGGGTPGATGIVPKANLPVPHMLTPGAAPRAPESTAAQAMSAGKSISELYKSGREMKNDVTGWLNKSAPSKTVTVASPPPAKPSPDLPSAGASLAGEDGLLPNTDDGFFIPGGDIPFAYGGVVPRHKFAFGGTDDDSIPGEGALNGSEDILSDVVKSGQQTPQSLPKPGEPPKPPPGVGSQLMQGAGMLSTASSLASSIPEWLAAIGLPFGFASGGLVPRQAHADGEGVIPADYSPEADLPAAGAQETSTVPAPPDYRKMVDEYSKRNGIDADHALRLVQGESGFRLIVGDEGSSPGLWQLHVGGISKKYPNPGLGDAYFDTRKPDLADKMSPQEKIAYLNDPANQEDITDFATSHIAKNGASAWTQAHKQGLFGLGQSARGMRSSGLVANDESDIPSRGAQPTGLVVDQSIDGEDKSLIPSSITDKLTSERYLLPALSFVGSMMASKSPFLGNAIGEGIVGGVGGYRAMQQQQMEMAKNLIDVVGNRFERQIGTDGNVIYRNKLTGAEVPANQMQNTIYSMFKRAGLEPEQYGIVPPGGAPASAPAQTRVAAGPAAGKPPATPDGSPATTPEGADTTAAPPKKTDASLPSQINITDMNETQLRRYIENNPQNFGLQGDDDPRKIRAKIGALKQRAEDYRTKLNDNAAAQEADRQAQVEQARLDVLLSSAAKMQADSNTKLNENQTKQAGDFENEVLKRRELFQRAENNWKRLGDIYSDFTTGRSTDFKTTLASWADGLGIPMPNLEKRLAAASNYDAAMKITMQEVYDAMARENLVRAPAASARGLSQTVPGASLTPGAVYEIIGKNLGEMYHVQNRDQAYLDQPRGTSPVRFLTKYDAANPYNLKKQVAQGLSQIPVSKDTPRQTIDSLYKTYGPYGYKPMGAEEVGDKPAQTPATPAIPEPLSGKPGLLYSPSRNQYRDAQGNIYDATGKRVQ